MYSIGLPYTSVNSQILLNKYFFIEGCLLFLLLLWRNVSPINYRCENGHWNRNKNPVLKPLFKNGTTLNSPTITLVYHCKSWLIHFRPCLSYTQLFPLEIRSLSPTFFPPKLKLFGFYERFNDFWPRFLLEWKFFQNAYEEEAMDPEKNFYWAVFRNLDSKNVWPLKWHLWFQINFLILEIECLQWSSKLITFCRLISSTSKLLDRIHFNSLSKVNSGIAYFATLIQ